MILELVLNQKLYTELQPHTSLRKVILHCIFILNNSLSKAIDAWNIEFQMYYVLCQQCLLQNSFNNCILYATADKFYILDDICFCLLLFPQQWTSLVYLQVLIFGIICVWLTGIVKCCVINLIPNSKLFQSQLRIIVLRYIIEVFTPHKFYFLFFLIFYFEVTFVKLTSFSLELMCVYI